MFSQALTIAKNTFLESVRQPIYFVLTAICAVAILLTTMTAAYSMDYSSSAEVSSDDRVLLDIGLATVFVCGVLLAAFLATAVISKEIERKTVLTVVSKPVARPTLILGKYFGVASAILIAAITMMMFLFLALRHKVMSTAGDDLDAPVIAFGFGAVLLSLGIGVWFNFFYGTSFTQACTLSLFPLIILAYVGVLFIDKKWEIQPIFVDFKPETTKAAICVLLAIMVLTAVATAASSRLGQVMTLVICAGVFMLGLMSNALIGSRAIQNTLVSQVIDAQPESPSMAPFATSGDVYKLRLELEPRVNLPAGSPIYYGINPSGYQMEVRPFSRFDGDVNDPVARSNRAEPPALAVVSQSGRDLTIVRTGGEGALTTRPPAKGDYLFLQPTKYNAPAMAAWTLLPNVQFFWLLDAVSQNQPIPWSHVGKVALYAATLIGALLCLAIVLFQKREVG